MEIKERLWNYFRLKETKKTWYLNAILRCDCELGIFAIKGIFEVSGKSQWV